MIDVSFLVSTRGGNPQSLSLLLEDLARQTFRGIEIVIVLQPTDGEACSKVNSIVCERNDIPVQLFVTESIGLSKSRNIALDKAKGEMLVLCDDDCRYPRYAAEVIWRTMTVNCATDIMSFKMADLDSGEPSKKYSDVPFCHTIRSLMHVSSVETVLRRRVLAEGKLFDERIGLGTCCITGAENVMLVDLFRKGYHIDYAPHIIVFHPSSRSGTGSVDLGKLMFSKAVMFRRIFGVFGIVPAAIFFIRRLAPGKRLRAKPRHFWHVIRGLCVRI